MLIEYSMWFLPHKGRMFFKNIFDFILLVSIVNSINSIRYSPGVDRILFKIVFDYILVGSIVNSINSIRYSP